MNRLPLLLIAAGLVGLLLGHRTSLAQGQPPAPTTVYSARIAGTTVAGEFDVVSTILDFAPGAGVPLHTHGGPVLVLMLAGEMTFGVDGQAPHPYQPGESWIEVPGEYRGGRNTGTTTARISGVLLLPRGAKATTLMGGLPSGDLPPGPQTVYSTTLAGITMPGAFDATNLIIDFAPGAATPAQTHGGPGIVTVIAGAVAHAVEGQPEQIVQAGESWIETPGAYGVVSNKSGAPARVSAVFLLPTGAALTTVQPPPGMPTTGVADRSGTLWLIAAGGLLLVLLGDRLRIRRGPRT